MPGGGDVGERFGSAAHRSDRGRRPCLCLQARAAARASPAARPTARMSPGVLIVDDDRAALYALSEVLGDVPVRLVLATSGEEARRQVLKNEFAAILLDVRLPNLDGFVVAAAVGSLERARRIPIIFMSAHEARRRQLRVGAVDEQDFRKPLVPELVRSKVAELVASPPPALGAHEKPLQNQA